MNDAQESQKQEQKQKKEPAKNELPADFSLRTLPVSEFLERLPKSIKGASSVDIVGVPDAKHCLVHIRQVHTSASADTPEAIQEELKTKKGKIMIETQTDISMILLHLRGTYGKFDVHDEGFIGDPNAKSESNDVYERCQKIVKRKRLELADIRKDLRDAELREKLEQSGIQTFFPSAQRSERQDDPLRSRKGTEVEQLREDEKRIYAILKEVEAIAAQMDLMHLSAGYLNRRGMLGLKPSETRAARDAMDKVNDEGGAAYRAYSAEGDILREEKKKLKDARQALEKETDKEKVATLRKDIKSMEEKADALQKKTDQLEAQLRKKILEHYNLKTERRENTLLQIAKGNGTVTVTVYGGIHDWENNVQEWNKANPKDKFELITITPASYEKHFGARRPQQLDAPETEKEE